MSSEYYTLEKTSEVLGLPPAEVNRLRERSQLRAFRDGSSWKFRKVDVDNFLAETIKNRGKQKASDSDFDLLGNDEEDETPTLLADSASFDALMEDGLSLDDEMIDAKTPSQAQVSTKKGGKSDADLTLDDDGLSLVDDSSAEVDLSLGDDDVALDGSGSSPKLNLAEDSGLSLLDAADDVELLAIEKGGSDANLEIDDDDDILSLVDAESAEQTSTIAIPVEDDFQLTPSADALSDDSESSSQVIALEEDNMFGAPVGMAPETPFGAAPAPMTPSSPFSSGPGEFVAQTPTFAGPTVAEPAYGAFAIVMLVVCTFSLAICGCMGLDLIMNIWSWKEPFVINSTIMDLVAGVAGLK